MFPLTSYMLLLANIFPGPNNRPYSYYFTQLIFKLVKRKKGEIRIYIMFFNYIITCMSSLWMFMWIWITIWDRLLSTWRISLSITCKAGQLTTNSQSFHLYGNVFSLILFLIFLTEFFIFSCMASYLFSLRTICPYVHFWGDLNCHLIIFISFTRDQIYRVPHDVIPKVNSPYLYFWRIILLNI